MLKGRSHGRWQHDAEGMQTARLVRRLERHGFAAIYFNREAFADGGEKLLQELAAAGRTQRIESASKENVVVLLEPAPKPEFPSARMLTFGKGWHDAKPGAPRWAYEPATFSHFNPHRRPVPATLRLEMSGMGERNLVFRVNRKDERRARIGEEKTSLMLKVTLRPGFNRIDVESIEPAVRVEGGVGQLRAFAVHEASIEIDGERAAHE
jgi:hypothetical protein